MKTKISTISVLLTCALLSCFSAAHAQDKPNIVLVFMDNFGWGEPGFNGGGVIRGAPTPRLDNLAAEGLRTRGSRDLANAQSVPPLPNE